MPVPMGRNRSMNQSNDSGNSGQEQSTSFRKKWKWIVWAIAIAGALFIGKIMIESISSDSEKSQQEIATLKRMRANNQSLTDSQIAILEGSKSKEDHSKEKVVINSAKDITSGTAQVPEQEFNWWVLFPFALALLMLYIIFFTKPKALSLGAVLILIGTLVFFWYYRAWFLPGLDMVGEKLGQPVTISGTATQQPTYNESEWVTVREKTCEVAWNNTDFKKGWCNLGEFSAGEYRFEVKSLLTKTNVDGTKIRVPVEGFPLKSFEHDPSFLNYVNSYHPLPTEGVWRLILKKSGGEQLFKTSSIVSARDEDHIGLSINIANTEDNWKTLNFDGKIIVEILKKKT